MSRLLLTTPVMFGLESIVAKEIRDLGYETTAVEDGRVTFEGDEEAICVANINLRTAERVLVKLGEFTAKTFDQLFEGVKALEWADWIGRDDQFPVKGHSIKSALYSIPDCQSIVKRAVVESLKGRHKIEKFPETGDKYQIQFSILKDVATLYIDTTGDSLYKRGYRPVGNKAPLRETLSAALISLSHWGGSRGILLDPMCGSGTIAIEAAMYALNIAPGINRSFTAETWSNIPKSLWKDIRQEAIEGVRTDVLPSIVASDIDPNSIKLAKENAQRAGVLKHINFSCKDMNTLKPITSRCTIICNPPYGERLLEKKDCELLYKQMGEKFASFTDARYFVLTSHEQFEQYFGKKADKKRKLYNGMIKCNLYQYLNCS